ncbi:MAG: SH3 domain-containing protein [Propionibacteriaceae bacterium]|nr:SH3 domain-containing protein [Propionibacteriaceae bacterium]
MTTLPYGASVSLTGVTDNGFLQIAYQGGTAWVSGSWVSQSSAAAPAPAPAAPPAAPAALPAVTGQRQTAADLNFRSGPGLNHGVIHVIPNGATIDVTGASQNGFLQIVRQNQAGWVSAQYVKDITAAAPTPAPVPAVTGQLFTTDYLNVRTQASSQGSVVTVLAKGSKVDITGATSGTWHQIIYQGAVRWVASAYLAATAPAADPVPAQTMTPAQAQANARQQVAARGWGDDQFRCLVELWNKESGWRMNAENPYSGAYGIPQALPGSKMASAGADWRTNAATQISWGLGYISQRYSTPCGAWGFFQSNNWY